jgi:low affinity Fe/Cu permease
MSEIEIFLTIILALFGGILMIAYNLIVRYFNRIEKQNDEIDAKLDKLIVQKTKTNGRVTALESRK